MGSFIETVKIELIKMIDDCRRCLQADNERILVWLWVSFDIRHVSRFQLKISLITNKIYTCIFDENNLIIFFLFSFLYVSNFWWVCVRTRARICRVKKLKLQFIFHLKCQPSNKNYEKVFYYTLVCKLLSFILHMIQVEIADENSTKSSRNFLH